MAKKKKFYCEHCEKRTKHIKRRNIEGWSRLYFNTFTLGAADLIQGYWWECVKCGK